MVFEEIIRGKYVSLQSACEDDADFTLSLRQDPVLTKYLPRLDITLQQQKEWIRKQRATEGDYFFVVRTLENQPIGTVSIYDIKGYSSESGRLALIGNACENMEASLLLFHFAFDIIGLKEVKGYILDGNKRAERFNRQFGCIFGEPETNKSGDRIRRTLITDSAFHEAEKKLSKMLYREEWETST